MTSAQLQSRIIGTEYKARLLSDHSPLVLTIDMPDKQVTVHRWRFNTLLLRRPDFCNFIRNQINMFCETNADSTADKFLLWDTLKAYLRGQIISYASRIKKEYTREVDVLEKEITILEKDLQQRGSVEKHRRLISKKLKYNTINTYRMEKMITKSKQRYYELGERAHKVLSWQLKSEQASRTINAIKSNTGRISYKPKDINEAFKQFYMNLYESQSVGDLNKIESFLSQLDLPNLNLEEQGGLNAPFNQVEIGEALLSLQVNKSPGEDGFPPEFYKEFKDLLIPLFMEVLDQAVATRTLPESFSTAIITVIPKKDRDPLKPSSYRPISLLNTDYKIIAKALANRLAIYLPKLINVDQTGFVQKRQSADNVSRLLSIIHLAQTGDELCVALALDAEKAFDRLEWDYLFKVLGKFGLGEVFINWVKALYYEPKAKVITNGQISSVFPLSRSSRQGCPLSPALFVLAIEPLAESIRQDPDIKGFRVNQEEHKINLFADDVLIYLTDPASSLQKLQSKLEFFGTFSGYKVNWDKSEVMPLTGGNYDHVKRDSQFKWPLNGIKYLGIKIDNNLQNLYVELSSLASEN